MAFETQIKDEINERSNHEDEIEEAWEQASIRTNSDGVYTSIDFDVAGETHSVSFDELEKMQKANKEK